MGEVTRLLDDARSGDPDAWDSVVSVLYEELLRMARRVHAGGNAATLNPTALVNECYLRVARRQAEAIENREHFLAVAARAMRQILVNYARDRMTAKRGNGVRPVTLDEETMGADEEAGQLLALNDALERLAHEDERFVRIVDCRVFGGLTEAETAAALDMSLRNVQRLWRDARERMQTLLSN